MEVVDRIEKLRDKMSQKGLDAYIIPSSDPHMSEYVASHWQGRKWLSGFTGSAGTLVVTQNVSGLWTDGRYYIQAEKQLQGSGIRLFKGGMEGVPDFIKWLVDILDKDSCVGIDGRLFSISQVRDMEKKFSKQGITINKEYDLLEEIWQDRPAIPQEPIFIHDVAYAGRTAAQKIEKVREKWLRRMATFTLYLAWTILHGYSILEGMMLIIIL